jgi:hypothetical protein
MSNRKLYTTLIGINAYEKARSLNGCIKDILNADRFLRNLCSQQQGTLEYKPLYLLAPHASDKGEIEQYKTTQKVAFDPIDPTFSNVTGKAFDHLAQASGNDICLLYYSGHGSFINAAPEFWHAKATHQSETLVCVDSRSASRDLIDKELAYLLHKTLKDKPDVHCLVIMDCCHSGNNSRALDDSDVPQYRQESPSNQQVALQDYLGFKENFFTIENGKADFTDANYVHLAACRDHEKALDGYTGGVFSRRLIELLNKSGRNASYRSIVQSLAATVSIQNGSQNPVAFSAIDSNLDRQFLGGHIIPYTPSYEVRYIDSVPYWQLQAGSLQGIVPSVGDNKTLLHITPADIIAEVSSVDDFTATLTGEGLKELDIASNDYTATIKKLAIKRQVIGFSPKLKKKPDLIQQLVNQFNANSYVYFELNNQENANNDFLIDVLEREDKSWYYYLSQTTNDLPLFKAETDSKIFLDNVDAVGKWIYVKGLESGTSIFKASDFIFTVKVIEGTKITANNIDNLPGKTSAVAPGARIELAYKNDLLPALQFSVEINPESAIKECFIQALYLDGLYGIKTDFSEADTNRLTKGGKVELKTNVNGRFYNLIRLQLDKELAAYHINEIIEQLKIVVSTEANIQLNAYAQRSLEAEPARERGATRSVTDSFFDSNEEANWAVFNFNVRIIGPEKGKALTPGAQTVFSSFSIQAPAGFNAVATAVTNADIPPPSRSLEKSTSPAVWGNILAEQAPFGDDVASMIDSSVIALELSAIEGQPMPVLREGEELIINVKQNAGATRSIDGYESTIVPYGYDEATQLYFPIGYEDLAGNIRINQLPQPSGDTLLGEAVTTRSLFGSIKLYFKKILRLPVNTLALHLYKTGAWETVTDMGKIKQHIQTVPQNQKLPLIVHGIFGDTKGILEGLKADKELAVQCPAILSFDFENMSTEVPDTASVLKEALGKVGIGEQGMHKLTIIAHSMGGLVSRWLIEKEGGAHFAQKLIMAGTPNGGSEWSQASGHILNGAKFLLTHALNVAGPIKYAITGISFFLKKFHDPQTTLKGMDKGSAVIKELGKQAAASTPIPYFLVGSDTSLFRDYHEQDEFLLKVKNLLMKKIVFPGFDLALFHQAPNDMAVTLDSMKEIPGFDATTNMQTLPGDHISYFSDTATRKAILTLTYA